MHLLENPYRPYTMIEINWDKDTIQDPIALADAIECSVGFEKGYFSKADFSHALGSELLDDNLLSFVYGDKIDDRIEKYEQALRHIQERASRFGRDTYPFVVSNDLDEVIFDPGNSTDNFVTYLLLLMCSNQKIVQSPPGKPLHVSFENLCKEALKVLFPDWAEVLLFSQYSEDRKNEFGYGARDAVDTLASKLNTTTKPAANDLKNTSREFGIDIIAICPFDDAVTFPYFAFAQCTLSENWSEKRHQAKSSYQLGTVIDLDNVNHTNFMMIPHLPRSNNLTTWQDPTRTSDCILWDRYRISRMLEKSNTFDPVSPPPSLKDVFDRIKSALI